MKIICIGRNYAAHAKEMKSVVPEEPVVFMKPDTALLKDNAPFYYPSFSTDIHHEVELVVKINRPGKNIETRFAHKYYDELTVGIDFTARDLQARCKEKGLPWEKAKAFDGSAVVGTFINKNQLTNPAEMLFHLELNKKTVQQGNSADMLFSIDTIIAHVSAYFTLKTGDLIFTGTPEGVGAVKPGDRLEAFLNNNSLLAFDVK